MAPAPPPRRAYNEMSQPKASTPTAPIRVESGAAPPAAPAIRNATNAELNMGPIARLWAIASQVVRIGRWPSRCTFCAPSVEVVTVGFVDESIKPAFQTALKYDEKEQDSHRIYYQSISVLTGEPETEGLLQTSASTSIDVVCSEQSMQA